MEFEYRPNQSGRFCLHCLVDGANPFGAPHRSGSGYPTSSGLEWHKLGWRPTGEPL